MSSPEPRRPAAFSIDDPNVLVGPAPAAGPPPRRPFARLKTAEPPPPDPVVAAAEAEAELPKRLAPAGRPVPWATLFWSAAGSLVAIAIALSVVDLVADMYSRSGWLGTFGLLLATTATVAAAVIVGREATGLMRLKAIDHLRGRAAEAIVSDDRNAGRAAVAELLTVTSQTPALAQPRRRVQFHLNEIIDGRDLVHLAERELMNPLDQEAQRLVTNAAKRVSVVTAVSPRAAVDMIFVLITALGLVRKLALLYGGRPGTLGLVRLMRHVIAHLAVTGGLSVSDGLVQQMIGQGLAAKVSARLGEGVLNGLLTARLGLAAIDVTRPLPFSALRRPSLQDLAGGLMRGAEKAEAAPVDAAPVAGVRIPAE